MRHRSLMQSLKASASARWKLSLFFFMGISNHVEVATKHPRSFYRGVIDLSSVRNWGLSSGVEGA
jgi:hypothetical protein